jgi:phospholipase/carboxylesterase
MHAKKLLEGGVPLKDAGRAIILIHGRGAPAEDIMSLASYFDDGSTYFVAPEATQYTWYPKSFLMPEEQNQPWLDSAINLLSSLISELEEQIPAHQIYIMGFSQGACLTAEVSARNARKFGGIAVFTGGVIGDQIETSRYQGNFNGTKVYISNGDNDPHIPLHRTEETAKIMSSLGADVVKEIFQDRPHTVNLSEIEKVKQWFFG